jgi:hypothetical protein
MPAMKGPLTQKRKDYRFESRLEADNTTTDVVCRRPLRASPNGRPVWTQLTVFPRQLNQFGTDDLASFTEIVRPAAVGWPFSPI